MASGTSSKLMNLPTELVELLATFLETKDLCNLRLVCNKLVKDVDRHYAATVFPRLPIFISSDDSLESALAVVKQPTFGNVVSKVSFYIEQFKDPSLSPSAMNRMIWEKPDTDTEMSPEVDDNGDVLSEDLSEVEKARHQRLTTLLSLLQEFGNLQEVELIDLSHSGLCPIIPKEIDKAQLRVPDPRDIRCLKSVLRAIRDAHLSVPKFSVMPEHWAFSSQMAGSPPLSSLFESALQEVQHLQLHCWLLSNPSGPSYATKFMAAVASAPKLKFLAFRTVESWDPFMKQAFGDMTHRLTQSQAMHAILSQYYPNLETLELESGMIGSHIGVLRGFIRRHERLQNVVLEDVRCCFFRFDRHPRPGETQEGLARRYFELPGTYRVIEVASHAVRLDFTWTKNEELAS